jgi:hypothetical protein
MRRDLENFVRLRRLLALKRHEQPPPGFYQDFSAQVVARIRAGQRGEPDSWLERLLAQAPWLGSLGESLVRRPALVGAFGAAACMLMISLVVYSESAGPVSVSSALGGQAGVALAGAAPLGISDGLERNQLISSTNPVAPMEASLFSHFDLNTQPASLILPGN